MIVDITHNILSLIIVLIMLITRDFLIPLIVWRNYFKGKPYAFRFFFSLITQSTIQLNLVLFLGLAGILNKLTFIIFNIIIYSLIIWNFSNKKLHKNPGIFLISLIKMQQNRQFKKILLGEIIKIIKTVKNRILPAELKSYFKNNFLEIIFLILIFLYNIWFLNYNVLYYHSYQFSDIPVHQSWIYALEQGVPFIDGIYPFALHNMVYFLRSIFSYDLRELLLYSGAYQTTILMLSIYLLAKEIFKGKYSAITSAIIASFMLRQGRYAASLPQEMGMCFVVSMAYFMIKFLHKKNEKIVVRGDGFFKRIFRINSYINRKYINNDLILFMLSVALIINYYYFTAIAAIFLVFSLFLAYLPRVLKKQYLIPILVTGLLGGMIAILPIGVGLLKGIPFQESMNWATTVISGEEYKGTNLDYQVDLNEALGRNEESDINEIEKERVIDYSKMTTQEKLSYFYKAISFFGRMSLFGDEPTSVMLLAMSISFLSAIIMFFFRNSRNAAFDYMGIISYILIISIFGAAKLLGVPEIILESRASTFAQPFIGIIYMMPIDIFFRAVKTDDRKTKKKIFNGFSLFVGVLVIILIFNRGYYHTFFDVNLAYYNESEYVLRNIKKDYAKNDFTIVATTDEYYEVINHGRHTELSRFVNMLDKHEDAFTFPTRYVFFFIEKLVLNDYNYGNVRVDKEYAKREFVFLKDIQDYYFQRAIIQSKAYYWAESFAKLYPRNFKIFFEDDIYIVYRMEQNTYSPFKMQIDYLNNGEGEKDEE